MRGFLRLSLDNQSTVHVAQIQLFTGMNIMKTITSIQAILAKSILSNADKAEVLASFEALLKPSALNETTRALLPSLRGGAMFDTISDDIIIHVPAFRKATKAAITEIEVEKQSIVFKLPSYDIETVRYFSLALSGLLVQPDWSSSLSKEHNNYCKLTELVDSVIPMLQGLQAVSIPTVKTEFNFSEYGLDASMFVTDKPKHTYNMPANGEYKGFVKAYLKQEYIAQFFPLAGQGLFSMQYGIAQVTEGDFAGAFAVLLAPKQ